MLLAVLPNKELENVSQSQRKMQSIDANPKMTKMLDLSDKDFKAA